MSHSAPRHSAPRRWAHWLGRSLAHVHYARHVEPTWLEVNRLEVAVAGLPPAFDGWFLKAAAADPADRFDKAFDCIAALVAALGGRAPLSSAPKLGVPQTARPRGSGPSAPMRSHTRFSSRSPWRARRSS